MSRPKVFDPLTACLERDNHICQDCGSKQDLHVHHILPRSQGGKNELDNLKTVCDACHKSNYNEIHHPKDKSRIVPDELRDPPLRGIDQSKMKQLTLFIPKKLDDEISDCRFEFWFPSKAAAVREILRRGIDALHESGAEGGKS